MFIRIAVDDELNAYTVFETLNARGLDGVPVLSQLVSPDRWLLWLGVLFIVCVYTFPQGLVGRLRGVGK